MPEGNEEPEGIHIGPWILKKYRKGSIWIEVADDGESGEFSEEKLADWIRHFYEKHF